MKKLLTLLLASGSIYFINAQGPPYATTDEMQILNYSKFMMGGHVSATNNGSFPALQGPFSYNIYPVGDPLGRNITSYRKYMNSQLSSVPINTWWIATAATTNYLTQPSTSPVLNSPFGTLTGWGGMQVEYWEPNTGLPAGGFSVNYDARIESPGGTHMILTYPMTYSDANISVTSFYTGGTNNDYIVIIS